MTKLFTMGLAFFAFAAIVLFSCLIFADNLDAYFNSLRASELARKHQVIEVRAAIKIPSHVEIRRSMLTEQAVEIEKMQPHAVHSVREACQHFSKREVGLGAVLTLDDLSESGKTAPGSGAH